MGELRNKIVIPDRLLKVAMIIIIENPGSTTCLFHQYSIENIYIAKVKTPGF